MPVICPVSDLETKLSEITRVVHESDEPVFLTNKGYGDMVVMSMNIWEEMNFENEIYQKLIEAQAEAQSNPMRLSHNEVFDLLRQKINNYINDSFCKYAGFTSEVRNVTLNWSKSE